MDDLLNFIVRFYQKNEVRVNIAALIITIVLSATLIVIFFKK